MRRSLVFNTREIPALEDSLIFQEPFAVDKDYTSGNTAITSEIEENDYLSKMFYNTDPLRYGEAWPCWFGATPSVNEGYNPDWWQGGGGTVAPHFEHSHGSGMGGVKSIPIKVTHEKPSSTQSSGTEKSKPKVHHVPVSFELDPLVLGSKPQHRNYFQNIRQDPSFNTEDWGNSRTTSGLKQARREHNLTENDAGIGKTSWAGKQTDRTVEPKNVRHIPVTIEPDTEELKPKLPKINGSSPSTMKKKKEYLHVDRLGNISSQEKKKAPVEQQYGGANSSSQHTSSQVSGPVDPLEQILAIQKELETLQQQVSDFSGTAKDKHYRYLDEMLTRCMLKLDNIETGGEENIRKARKAVVNKIQAAISQLDAKVTSPKNENGHKELVETNVGKPSNSTEEKSNVEEEMEVADDSSSGSKQVKMDQENKEICTAADDDVQVEVDGKMEQRTTGTELTAEDVNEEPSMNVDVSLGQSEGTEQTTKGTELTADEMNEEPSMNVDVSLGQSEGTEQTTKGTELTADEVNEEPSMNVDVSLGQSEGTEQKTSGLQVMRMTENSQVTADKEEDAAKCTTNQIEEGTLLTEQSRGEENVQEGESHEITAEDRSTANRFADGDASCIQSDNTEIQMGDDDEEQRKSEDVGVSSETRDCTV
ncbi:BAG domain-containing protein Samui-like [Limulus polyphemus]|uniref:BAG domain-containing protein Samui-like n=1 Tax=Limulus polyphemus TaxID=6850 RepID=A0ABM1BM43_LIMPO|nr:BAG domain-containing protein Samui-like [Limulus polyphemus]